MSAPTTAFEDGTGTISATGESSGLLLTVARSIQNPRIRFGFAGTFTSVVVAIRGRYLGMSSYYPVRAVKPGTNTVVSDSTNISLTDSTNQDVEVDATGYDYLEVYVVSGTPTALTVEARQSASGGPLLSVVNLSVSGTQTYTGATTVNVSSATAFVVGPNGTTNPTLQVTTNTASAATGVKVTSAAAAAGVAIAAISSGTNESLTIDAKGSGVIALGDTSTSPVYANRGSLQALQVGLTLTALGTVQSSTPTAAQLLGGFLTQTGSTGAGAVTLPTGTALSAACPRTPATGDCFECVFANLGGGQTLTITGATGTTVVSGGAIATAKSAVLKFICTGSNAWSIAVIGG